MTVAVPKRGDQALGHVVGTEWHATQRQRHAWPHQRLLQQSKWGEWKLGKRQPEGLWEAGCKRKENLD